MSAARELALAQDLRERIVRWSRDDSPNEACGLLIGRALDSHTLVTDVTHARNVERERPTERYTVHPEDHLEAELAARAERLAVVGVWHSHPEGPATPSPTDLAGAAPGWTYVIVSLSAEREPDLRAFRLDGERFVPMQARIVP